MSKLEQIIKIAEQAGSTEIEVWTSSFKVMGTLFKDKERIANGIVSIQNPIVSPLLVECECSDSLYEWLNIFEDQIIALHSS
ncbi:MAG: hypothetical protein MZV64_27265 [Ignavibacteriales bacterium]|nr:hypothetical protein [Ignavibacteriales bacterium]